MATVNIPLNISLNAGLTLNQLQPINLPTLSENQSWFWNQALQNLYIKQITENTQLTVTSLGNIIEVIDGKLYTNGQFRSNLKSPIGFPVKGNFSANNGTFTELTIIDANSYLDSLSGITYTYPQPIDYLVPIHGDFSVNKVHFIAYLTDGRAFHGNGRIGPFENIFLPEDIKLAYSTDGNLVWLVADGRYMINLQGSDSGSNYYVWYDAGVIRRVRNYDFTLTSQTNQTLSVNTWTNQITGYSGDIYSKAISPWLYHTYFISGSTYYVFANQSQYSSTTVSDPSSNLQAPIIDYNRRYTFHNSKGATTLGGYESDILSNYCDASPNSVAHYLGQPVTALNQNGIPVAPFFLFQHFIRYTNGWILTNSSGSYLVECQDSQPYVIQECSPYVYMVNDGTVIIEENERLKIIPPRAAIFGSVGFRPWSHQTISNTNSVLLMLGMLNGWYTTERSTGGIFAPLIYSAHDELRMSISDFNYIANIPGLNVDVFFFQDSTGTDLSLVPKYLFSRVNNAIVTKTEYEGLLYPDSGTNPIYPIVPNATFNKTRSIQTISNWLDISSEIGHNIGNETMLYYYSTSELYTANSTFYLLGQSYYYDGQLVYLLNYDGAVLLSQVFMVNIEGLVFLGLSSEVLLFYSKEDSTLYGYQGSRTISPLMLLSNIEEIKEGLYTQLLNAFVFLSDTSVYILRNGTLSSYEILIDNIDINNQGILIYNFDGIFLINIKSGTPLPFKFRTQYLGVGQSDVVNWGSLWIRLSLVNRQPLEFNVTSDILYRTGERKTVTQKHKIAPLMWSKDDDFVVKIPNFGQGIGLSLGVNTKDEIRILSLDVDVEQQSGKVKSLRSLK